MRNETTHQQRCVEFQRDVHPQSEGQTGNLKELQDENDGGTNPVQHPRGRLIGHHGLYHGRHGVGLRGRKGFRMGGCLYETVHLI
ncbi:MAG: hypothetical protein ACD_62C00527G0001 [uncultured bacterium]|nr:MAG: hypothetical protein ACD_62C00527G0001 [uncultured bacterium]